MIVINRSQAQRQTVFNMVTAGVLKQEESEFYYKLLSAMSDEEALAALLESNQLKEDCLNPISYYPIVEISRN